MEQIIRITGAAAAKTRHATRDPRWAATRKRFIKTYPVCALCGGKTKLEVHHVIPFSVDPSMELDETNLIALCKGRKHITCHLIAGHGGNYQDYNPFCRETVALLNWLLTMRQKSVDNKKFLDMRGEFITFIDTITRL